MAYMVFKEDLTPVWWLKEDGDYSNTWVDAKVFTVLNDAKTVADDLVLNTTIPHYVIDETTGKSGNPSTRPNHP